MERPEGRSLQCLTSSALRSPEMLFRQRGADSRLYPGFHDCLLALFAELRMAENNLVLASGHRQVCQRGFAHEVAVDPDLCPRLRVDAHATVGRLNLQGNDFAGLDRDRLPRPEADRRVDEVQLVDSCRCDDWSIGARSKYALAFQYLQLDRGAEAKSAGPLALGGSGDR